MQDTDTIEQVMVDKARQLARELGSSRPFQEYERAREQFEADPSASALLGELRSVQQQTSTDEMLWGNSRSEWAAKMAEMQARVRAHPTIRTLREAENRLMALLFGCVLRLGDLTGIDYAEACTGRSLNGCGPAPFSAEIRSVVTQLPEVEKAIGVLGQSIQQATPYQALAQARGAFQNNPELSRIRKQTKDTQTRFIEAQGDGRLTLDLIDEVRSAQNELREHPVVLTFSEKRQEVHQLFQVVNRAVSEVLGIDVAEMVAPKTGCCG
jgi:cell fate (sporulation/competence/biofilm development) regulator YlbF (YheA/YmcA/DUF963 family)